MYVRNRKCCIGGLCFCLTLFSVAIAITVYIIKNGDSRLLQIECDEKRSGSMNAHDVVYLNFTNLITQTITFTNCESDFDTMMRLRDSTGNYIQIQSITACDSEGDYCYDSTYCTDELKETFTMESLSPGTYTIELRTFDMWQKGTFVVEVMCNTTTKEQISTDSNSQYEIACGETITGILTYPETASFNFTNPEEQEVLITSCGSHIVPFWWRPSHPYGNDIGTKLTLTNSSNIDIKSQSTAYCDDKKDPSVRVESLTPGLYTIEFHSDNGRYAEYDYDIAGSPGTFAVTLLCSQWNTFHIECGQSIIGNVTDREPLCFPFHITRPQTVTFTVQSSTSEPIWKLRNSMGEYVDQKSDSTEDGLSFTVRALLRGHYILELLPGGDTGIFSIEMSCNETVWTTSSVECGEMGIGYIKR